MKIRFDIVFYLFVISLTTMAVVHNLAVFYYLYWSFPWLDLPMHFLGGIVVALGYFSFLSSNIPSDSYWRKLSTVLFVVFAVGIVWEVFEYKAGIMIFGIQIIDTVVDLLLDILGGFVGFQLAMQLQTLNTTHEQ